MDQRNAKIGKRIPGGMAGNQRILMFGSTSRMLGAAACLAVLPLTGLHAQTIDFESSAYVPQKTVVGTDGWILSAETPGGADAFGIQGGPEGKWMNVRSGVTATLHREFPSPGGILDLRWKWRPANAGAGVCLGVSGSLSTARASSRALACLDPAGAIAAMGDGNAFTGTTVNAKAGVWQYMRMVLDNSPGVNKFTLYVTEDSLRGSERALVTLMAMGGSGAFTRLVIRGEAGTGSADIDDLSWEPTARWVGASPADSNWSEAINWSHGRIPDSATHVIFTEASSSRGSRLDKSMAIRSVTVAPGYPGTLDLGANVLTITGKADFTGGAYAKAVGHIRFAAPRGQSLIGPAPGKVLPSARHEGGGILRLYGRALFVENLRIDRGSLDFNGFDLLVTGDLSIRNGHPSSLLNLDGRSLSAGRSARLEGTSNNSQLGLNSSPRGWTLSVGTADSLHARFAALGGSRATSAAGYAVESVDMGGNSGWIFPAAPALRAAPGDTSVPMSGNAFFRISVSGVPAPRFQWSRDGADISGATDSVYALMGVKKSDRGAVFACKAVNSAGAVSAAAVLNVYFPAPTVSHPPGKFDDSLSLRILTQVAGAGIRISRNGEPFRDYPGVLVIRDSTTLRAFAILGADTSDVASWTFTPRPQAPVATPGGRAFADTVSIGLSTSHPGAAILYTLDGVRPGPKSLLYSGRPIVLDSSAVLQSIAVLGGDTSATATETYVLVPAAPTVSHLGGDYGSGITIELAASSAKARIYYTLDGSEPGPERGLPPYGGPFPLATGATLKAVAVVGYGAAMQRSPLLAGTYDFILPGPRILVPGMRIELSANHSLASPQAGAPPVEVEILPADSLKMPAGFRDILFGVRLSPSDGSAFPKVIFASPAEESRSLYSLVSPTLVRFLSSSDTAVLEAAGTYFLAVDTLPPVIAYAGEIFTAEDSTRVSFSISDNVSNLLLDLDRSDVPDGSFRKMEITGPILLNVTMKGASGSLSPLTLRLAVDDRRRRSAFPADGSPYAVARKSSVPVRSPAAFRIGSGVGDPWDFIAVPLALDPPLTLAQLRNHNAAPALVGAAYVAAAGTYRFLSEDEPLPAGKAVWLAGPDPLESLVFPTLQTRPRKDSGAYRLVLSPGWNQVASPALFRMHWPVTRADPDAYRRSPLKGLHAYDAGTGDFVHAEALDPWRGYYAHYRGGRDTVISLLHQPPAAGSTGGAGKTSAARQAASGGGFTFRLALGPRRSISLGAVPGAGEGFGPEDEPQPPARGDGGPVLYAARKGARLETDLVGWEPGKMLAWKIVAGLPGRGAARQGNAGDSSAIREARLDGLSLPEGYAAWAVSRKRGLRFPLHDGGGIPLHPGFTDSLDVYAGPERKLESALASIPESVGAFDARIAQTPGGFTLGLNLPAATRLRWTLWSLDGRVAASKTMDLPEGRFHFRETGRGGLARGLYVLSLEWNASGLPGRLSRKIAVP